MVREVKEASRADGFTAFRAHRSCFASTARVRRVRTHRPRGAHGIRWSGLDGAARHGVHVEARSGRRARGRAHSPRAPPCASRESSPARRGVRRRRGVCQGAVPPLRAPALRRARVLRRPRRAEPRGRGARGPLPRGPSLCARALRGERLRTFPREDRDRPHGVRPRRDVLHERDQGGGPRWALEHSPQAQHHREAASRLHARGALPLPGARRRLLAGGRVQPGHRLPQELRAPPRDPARERAQRQPRADRERGVRHPRRRGRLHVEPRLHGASGVHPAQRGGLWSSMREGSPRPRSPSPGAWSASRCAASIPRRGSR